MGQRRLNAVAVCHVHQATTRKVPDIEIAREYAALNHGRRPTFGAFYKGITRDAAPVCTGVFGPLVEPSFCLSHCPSESLSSREAGHDKLEH